MAPNDLVQQNDGGTNIENRDELVARYQQMRSVSRKLNDTMVARLGKDILREGGEKLGILRGDTFVFDNEDDTAFLMDYCLYDVRRNGRNAIEQYLLDSPPEPDSDEMACLRAMQRAEYILCIVESVIPGLGVKVTDLIAKKSFLMVDLGFGSTAKPGLIFASRIQFREGFAMSCGAAVPFGLLPEDQREEVIAMLEKGCVPDEAGYFDPAPLIRACLSNGSPSHSRYRTPARRQFSPPPMPELIAPPRIGRNEPCRCGSGKKYKNCCMRR